MKLSQFSLSFMYWSTHILMYFMPILGALCLIFPFLYTRRGIDRNDHKGWKDIKFPLIIALIPFVFIEYFSVAYFLTLRSERSEIIYYQPFITAFGIFLLSIITFGVGLFYKGKLSAHLVKRFVIGSLIGLFIFNGILIAWIFCQEMILRTDPAYVEILNKIKERAAARA